MTKPKSLADVQAGDEVVMVYRTGRRTNGRSEDQIVSGVVTDAKRVNLTITEKEMGPYGIRTWHVRRDTGSNKDDANYGWKAYTVEEHEFGVRQLAALRTIRRHGFYLDHNSLWWGREIELADVLTRYITECELLARHENLQRERAAMIARSTT